MVTYTGTDASGNAGTATQSVTVVDTTPPDLTAPAALTVEANATGGATGVDLGTASLSDIADAIPSLTNDAPAFFPLGTTVVTYIGTDASGNTATATQSVTVEDTTPPDLSVPEAISVEGDSTGGAGAGNAEIAAFLAVASAADVADPAPIVSNNAPEFFPLGATVVNFTATDALGNSVSASATVTVVDTTPPELTVPASITLVTNTAAGLPASDVAKAVLLAGTSVSDIVDSAPSLSTDAPAQFLVGATRVTFTATDASSNSVSATTLVLIELVVNIDIKPGSDPNSLNLNGNGNVPVAVLGSNGLDVTAINVATVNINGATPTHNGHIEDVNGDGINDLVVHLSEGELGIPLDTPGETILTLDLTGELNDGTAFSGQDNVRITPNSTKARGKGGKGPK